MNKLYQLKDLKDIEILEIKQFENRDRDRPEFDNKYLKILYFFTKEGIFPTLKKFYAHRRKQQRFLTFLFTQFEEKRYLNISVQSQTNPSDFVIINEFFECPGTSFEYPVQIREEYFDRYNQFCSHSDYGEFGIDTSISISYQADGYETDEFHNKGLFIYGLGGYVRMFIMQHFKRTNKIACVDYKSEVAEDFRNRYDFKHSFIIPEKTFPLLRNVKEPVAIISTYHSDHASLAEKIFHINPATQIFIEKPPTVTLEDLDKLVDLYKKGAHIEIGFNRRFIGFSQYVQRNLKGRTAIITCTIKEVNISDNHWYFWSNQGTRITGNVVHWFDLANSWLESTPKEINVIADPGDPESSAISVLYKDGSVLNITASDKGNSLRGVQEKIEVRFDNETIFIDDFNTLTHYKSNGVRVRKRTLRRRKGHVAMYKNFKKIIEGKTESMYSVHDLIETSIVTFNASEMLKTGDRSRCIEDEIFQYLNRII